MKQLSFIIPCYNAALYVEESISCLYKQGLTDDDFEVICVDDCSTDNTVEVIQQMQQQHKNLYLLRHKVNKKSGEARNTGVDYANGKYITFVDADDAIPEGMLGVMIDITNRGNLDILIYNNEVIDRENHDNRRVNNYFIDSEILSGNEFVDKYFPNNIGVLGAPWSKIYNREFLIKNNLRHTNLAYSEDSPFAWEALICAKRVQSSSKIGYTYKITSNSMSSTLQKPYIVYSNSFIYPQVLISIINRYHAVASRNLIHGMFSEACSDHSKFYAYFNEYGEKESKELFDYICDEDIVALKCAGIINRKQRIVLFFKKYGYHIFRMVLKIVYIRKW